MSDNYEDLDNANTLARYCKRSQVLPDGRPAHDNFRPRVKDGVLEDHLSTDCLEMLGSSTREVQLELLRTNCTLKRKPRDMFALLNVGDTKEVVRRDSSDHRVLGFKHVPRPGQDSHCGIFGVGIGIDEELIQKIIAEEVFLMVSATPVIKSPLSSSP